MIRINRFPLYQLGMSMGGLIQRIGQSTTTRADVLSGLAEARMHLDFAANRSFLPADSKAAALALLKIGDAITEVQNAAESPALSPSEQGTLVTAIMYLWSMLARDLSWFDLYWIEPKLGYSTPNLLQDARTIFPESIRDALPPRIVYEVQQATNCLLYDAPSAVGFHVLRAVEIMVLEYFTLPGWSQRNAKTWTEYAKQLSHYGVHRKNSSDGGSASNIASERIDARGCRIIARRSSNSFSSDARSVANYGRRRCETQRNAYNRFPYS